MTAHDAEPTLDYFRSELRPLGWSLWSARDGAPQAEGGIAGELTADGASATYVRDNNRPLMLTLNRRVDNSFDVEIKGVSADQLATLRENASGNAHVQLAPIGTTPQTELIPVPQASENVDFDGTLGAIKFTNRASAGIIAEYYRSTLQPLGWQEKPAAIDKEGMVVLRFTSGAKDLSIAITQTGTRTKVTIEGSGVKVAAAISRSM